MNDTAINTAVQNGTLAAGIQAAKTKKKRNRPPALPSQATSSFTVSLSGKGAGTAVRLDSPSVRTFSYFTLEAKDGSPIFQKLNKGMAIAPATGERFDISGRTGFLVAMN